MRHKTKEFGSYLFSLILVLGIVASLPAQDFTFTSDETTILGEVGVLATFHATITNISSSQIVFQCELDTTGYPADWYFSWCVGMFCLPPFIFQTIDTISAGGSDSISVYLTPMSVQESGSVAVTVFPEGMPSAAQSLTFTVTFGSGIKARHLEISPREFHLNPAYPNPFNPSTEISYRLATTAMVELSIYNLLGERVMLLYEGIKPAGEHRLEWNGSDSRGMVLPAGVYYVYLRSSSQTTVTPVVKLK